MQSTRRSFMKGLAAGAAGLAVNPLIQEGTSHAQALESPATVALVAGKDRRQMIYDAMKPFKSEIEKAVQGKTIIIKPNNTWDSVPLCATHPDALRGVLDLLKEVTGQTVTIAESTASPKGTLFTFEQYGYMPLQKEYKVSFRDLNAGTSSTRWIMDSQSHPLPIEIIDDYLDPTIYMISLAIPKTHDSIVATLGLKNVLMGSPINVLSSDKRFISNQYEKAKMHQGAVGINFNLFELARDVRPEFTVLDGVVGMEGDGPVGGAAVEHGIALAGPDVVAVDRIGIELMGVDYEDVGYLQWCAAAGFGQGDRTKIKVLGPDPKAHIIKYKPHSRFEWQLGWKDGKA